MYCFSSSFLCKSQNCSSIVVVFFSFLLQVTSSWPMIQPDLEQIQTAVNCPGSKVGKAIVSCFPLINKNNCIAVSCFLQGHCFPRQEEALCGGPRVNFICTLRGQIMSTSRLCRIEEQRQPTPGQLVSMQMEPFPCLDYLVGPKACNPFNRKKKSFKNGP